MTEQQILEVVIFMGLTGPPPKENRRRNNKDTFSADKVVMAEPEGDLDELRTIPEGEWLPEVQSWWGVWSTCAQSKLFTSTDWLRLRVLIVTVQSYYLRPTAQKMAEIRQTEGLLGATYVDRLRARMKIEKAEKPTVTAPGVTAMQDYRKRLAAG